MSDRSNQVISQAQALWRQGVEQAREVAGHAIHVVAERLEQNTGGRRKAWFNRALKKGARWARSETVFVPAPVKQALGILQHVVQSRMAAHPTGPRAPASQASVSCDGQAAAKAQASSRVSSSNPPAEGKRQTPDEKPKRGRPAGKRQPRGREKLADV